MRRFLLLMMIACAVSLTAAPNRICIPVANGVPGTLAWQKPPNWWNAAEGEPLYNTALDAPGWRGASAVSFPAGGAGTDHVHFRALHRNVSGTEYMYLSWWGKVVPLAASGLNELYVGFHDGAGLGQDVVLRITLTSFADTGTRTVPIPSTAQYAAALFVKPNGSLDSAWTTYPGSPAVPAWINGAGGTGRVWVFNAGGMLPAIWAFQLRVPITASNDLNNGIRVTSPFNMWYEFRAANPANPNGYTAYFWPRNSAQMSFSTPRPVAEWGETRITSGTPESPDPLCPADGVSLISSNIGTLNADPHKINLASANTLFATPNNGMAAAVNLTATFRIANWGTGATWENVPSPNASLWTQIGVAGPTSVGPGMTQMTTSYTASGCEPCMYQVFYAANTATCNATCGGAGTKNNTKRNHQCLLVQLSGAGVDFTNDSAYNNMNFAPTSVYAEDADVNLSGLPETAPGSLERDVYIYVQKSNMPAGRPQQPRGGGGQPGIVVPGDDGHFHSVGGVMPTRCLPDMITDPNVPRDDRQAAIIRGLSQAAFTFEDLQQFIPTVVYHAYYDTGQDAPGGGPVLRPLNPFGYFPMHDGTPDGWRAVLENAELIAPDWYRIHVGPSGLATVRPVIEAIEPRGGGAGGQWRLFVDAGRNFPDDLDGDFSINAGIERILSPIWSVEGVLGHHQFGGVRDIDAWQLSVNGMRFFGAERVRPYVFGGAGLYAFDPGDTELGINLGVGVLYELNAKWGIEGVYNYHKTDPLDWSTAQVGVRWHF